MLLEWKISVCSQSSQFTSKKVKFSEDFSKRVNPYNLSDKLGSINYFIRMYSEDLIGDLKAIFRIIMNTVSTFMSHWSQEQSAEHCNAPLLSMLFFSQIHSNMVLVYPCFSLTFKNFLLGKLYQTHNHYTMIKHYLYNL